MRALRGNTSGVIVRWVDQAVVHPFSFTARINNLRAAQVCKVPRNLGLAGLKNRNQKADAYFRIANQTDQPQTRAIRQRLKRSSMS